MVNMVERYVLDKLQEITIILEKDGCKISLVMDTVDGKLFVKRHFATSNNIGVYKSLLNVRHSALPKIYHVIELGAGFVVIEEYINGSTLKATGSFSPFSIADVANIAIQLCDALDMLHKMNPPIIHRDINPSNIMLAYGEVKLIDFDAAKEYKTTTTEDTTTLGTKAYAAPEQFGYAKTDARTDIYCLGATMYYMLSGKPYIKGNKLPAGKIGRVIQKCLQIDPNNRYQNAGALQEDLIRLKNRQLVSENIFQKFFEIFAHQHSKIAIIAGAFFVVVVATVLVILLANAQNSPAGDGIFLSESNNYEQSSTAETVNDTYAAATDINNLPAVYLEAEEIEPPYEPDQMVEMPMPTYTAQAAPQPPTNITTEPAIATEPAPATETLGQANARLSAQMYLNIMPFSRQSLINQLVFEGFSLEYAIHGTDSLNANWNEQAALSAQTYLNIMPFSRQGLIDQLVFEGFTVEQATYGVNSVGL